MASKLKRQGKSSYRVAVHFDGSRKDFGCFTNKRESERMTDKIKILLACRKSGSKTPEVVLWLDGLKESNRTLYNKLAAYGLAEPLTAEHTLADLFQKFYESQENAVADSTILTFQKVERNLVEFFGAGCELKAINYDRADSFASWLRSTPLNRRKKGTADCYGEATVLRRLTTAKQIFQYAKRIGWIVQSPFEFVKGGESVNEKRWAYVPTEDVETVLSACTLPKWRAIMALGRFAGIRGPVEAHSLRWSDIEFSSIDGPGKILIHCNKTDKSGLRYRVLPLHPSLERELSALYAASMEEHPEGEEMVFPGMQRAENFSVMIHKIIEKAKVPCWENPFYNLRKSFCSDMMEAIHDPKIYEYLTDHSHEVAMRHYQILHPDRMKRGMENVQAAFEAWGEKNDVRKKCAIGAQKHAQRCVVGNSVECRESDVNPVETSVSNSQQKTPCDDMGSKSGRY